MNRLFLIDAYAMIYRAYYAFMKMDRRTSSGLSTGVIYGFLNTVNELRMILQDKKNTPGAKLILSTIHSSKTELNHGRAIHRVPEDMAGAK